MDNQDLEVHLDINIDTINKSKLYYQKLKQDKQRYNKMLERKRQLYYIKKINSINIITVYEN